VCVCTHAFHRQNGLVEHILRRIEPSLFHEKDVAKSWWGPHKLEILCFAMRVSSDAFLPTTTHDVEPDVEILSTVMHQHYNAIGKPLSATSQCDPEDILLGWYRVDDKKITCVADVKDEKTVVDFSYATSAEIMKPLQHDTEVSIQMGGRESVVSSLAQEFSDAGVALPTFEVEWQSSLLEGARPIEETPSKRPRRSTGSASSVVQEAMGAAPPQGSERRGNVLNAALRQRLAKKMGQKD
jgi:hypothetical protein